MTIKKMLDSLSVRNKGLHYRLVIVFALFFLFPVLAFAYFAFKYDILSDEITPLLALALLTAAFFGYTIIRKIFDDICAASQNITETIAKNIKSISPEAATSELQGIVNSFHSIGKELNESFRNLDRRVSQISTLKELSDLCYVTFDPEDLFYITLERALKLVNADIGSVMILEQPQREAFILLANIGHTEGLSKGDRIVFADSIAKYAVINKSPLLVDNIETDIRFGRFNRPIYGTKSFLCMPLKGIKDVIGVLSLSRREIAIPFTQDDVDVLTPMLSSASFTYDNLGLMKKNDKQALHLKALDEVHHILISSLQGNEVLGAIINQIRVVFDIPCDMVMVLFENENNPDNLRLLYSLSDQSTTLSRDADYPYAGAVVERVIKQGTSCRVDDRNQWSHPIDEALFSSHNQHSCLLFPMKVAGIAKGVLALGFMQTNIPTDQQEHIERLANLLALAIEKDRLLTSVMKRDQDMALIKQIGSLLAASTFDMQEVLRHTMDLIQATLEVQAGCLMLLDRDELVFTVVFNSDDRVNIENLHAMRLKLGKGIAGYCAARGEPMMIRDARASKRFSPEFDLLTGFTTRSVLCVPLISQGRVTGVIEVINKLGSDFNDNDLQLLQSIATSVSIAMENARLYQETLLMAEQERSIRSMFQKFVPKEIVDKIIHDKDGEKPILDELKTVTLMNIDIRGFSHLAQTLGPQKTVAILNHFFSIMGEIVFKHQGIVDKYLGDGFLALFGAPVSDIHDADHAVDAALEMRATIGSINDHFIREIEAPLTTGISLHTGKVVAGNIGFEKKMDYTVIGDPVNAVFRLQNLARSLPNGILITENTLHALSNSRLAVREVGTYDGGESLGDIKIYELLG